MGVRRGDGMNKLVDALSWVAMRCTQNKYLNAIKNAFQNYMPISLTGAVGMLWTNVLVNDHGLPNEKRLSYKSVFPCWRASYTSFMVIVPAKFIIPVLMK